MTREETQFEVSSFEAGRIVLNGLEFYPAGEVEKIRVHYLKEDITCCLDTVTGLGDFFEIEVMVEESGYDEAIARINDLLQELGLSMEDTVRESYLCMLS